MPFPETSEEVFTPPGWHIYAVEWRPLRGNRRGSTQVTFLHLPEGHGGWRRGPQYIDARNLLGEGASVEWVAQNSCDKHMYYCSCVYNSRNVAPVMQEWDDDDEEEVMVHDPVVECIRGEIDMTEPIRLRRRTMPTEQPPSPPLRPLLPPRTTREPFVGPADETARAYRRFVNDLAVEDGLITREEAIAILREHARGDARRLPGN